ICSLKNELRDARCEINELKSLNQGQEREISQLSIDNEKLKSDLCEACNMYNSLAKRAECLEKELCNCQKKVQQLECDLQEMSKQLEQVCSDKSYCLKQVNKLEMDLSSACSEMRDLNSQLEEYKLRLCRKDEDLREAEAEIRSLDNQNQKLECK
ncbi:polyamine-modulated factor 1-binding protein 1, partial [Biomphalaria glabrata]